MIGQTLGHYRIVAEIGAGGTGVVYHAHDDQSERSCGSECNSQPASERRYSRSRFPTNSTRWL